MATIMNAAPLAILEGIQDVSPQTVEPGQELLPIHTPHVPFFAERGPVEALLVDPTDAKRIYGSGSFEYRKKYATHATALLVESIFSNANIAVLQRVVPDDAETATLAFSLDLVKTKVPVYQRDASGALVYDANGGKIDTGTTIDGYIGKWISEVITNRNVGAATKKVGTLTGVGGEQSMIYPMFDLEISSPGAYGNNVGVRLYAPNTASADPVNEGLINRLGSYVYRVQFVERANARSTPAVTKTLFEEQYVNFSLAPGAYDDLTASDYFVDNVVISNYANDGSSTDSAPIYSPFGKFKVYHANVAEVSKLIYATEKDLVSWGDHDAPEYLINLLGAADTDGNPHHSFVLKGVLDGGLSFTESTNHYALGGSDGTIDNATFDSLVGAEFEGYGELSNQFLDIARFPQSIVYDSGYSLPTKKALLTPLGVRKDIMVILSTQDAALPQNDASTETSMAVALSTAAELYPESTLYGTHVCRAAVVGQSGYLISSEYKGLCPLTFEVANMLSKFAGASNGFMKASAAPDISPNNRLTMLRDVKHRWKSAAVRNKDWDNGMIWAQSYSRNKLFIPAMQTVYNDDTSVLNSLINVLIAVECEKVAFRNWRDMTGRTDLTEAQYIKRSDKLISDGTNGRFADRVVIVPETYFTAADSRRGYSSAAKIHMYANNMRTVSSFSIVAHRMEDLTNE